MRGDREALGDILDAIAAIEGFIAGETETTFLDPENDQLRSAVLFKLVIIGEAIRQLSPDFRDRHPEVPWRDIIAFRNIVLHRYFDTGMMFVWEAATIDVVELRQAVQRIIEIERPKTCHGKDS
jgi:uncharacterized protein with HEPN domain